jgi:hypothetical protein
MSLTKQVKIDQITLTENGTVLYREVTCILENDVQITQTYHRLSLVPESDLTGVPAEIEEIAKSAWTPEVITAYKNALISKE